MNPTIRACLVAVLAPIVVSCSETDGAAVSSMCPPAESQGNAVGDTLPDVTVLRCDGSEVSLRSVLCAAEVSLLDIGSAAYPACVESTRAYASDPEFDSLQDAGLQLVQVFTTDRSLVPATTDFCERYTEFHEVDFEFFIDPEGATDALGEFSPLHFVVDGSGQVLETWNPVVPPDRIARLRGYLEAAGE